MVILGLKQPLQVAYVLLILFSNIASHHGFEQSEEATKFRSWEQSDLCAACDGLKKETSSGFCGSCRFTLKSDLFVDFIFRNFEL